MIDLLTFFESSKVVFINIVEFLMMSAKLIILDLLKIKLIWNKGYDVIITHYDVNKILSRGSYYIVEAVIWPKFGNCSICMREVIITWILKGFDQKNFFEGCCWCKFNNWLALGMTLKFYTSVAKGLKLKLRSYKGQTGGGSYHAHLPQLKLFDHRKVIQY